MKSDNAIEFAIRLPNQVNGTVFFVSMGILALVILTISTSITLFPRFLSLYGRWHSSWSINAAAWFAIILSPIWLSLLVFTIHGTFKLWFSPPDITNSLAYRVHYLSLVGLMTALAGLVGTPLALIRVFTTERQTKAEEDGLITDRINKAVEGLGAEKAIKSIFETPIYKKDSTGDWIRDHEGNPDRALDAYGQPIVDRQTIEQSIPNIEVRIGAIYA